MDDMTFLAILTISILVVQLLIYRYLKRNRYTADVSNQETIQAIALDMNRLSKTVSIMMEAAGFRENQAPPQNGAPGAAGATTLSDEEQARQRHTRKADLYKRFAGRS